MPEARAIGRGWVSGIPPRPVFSPRKYVCTTQDWLPGRPLTDFGRRRPNLPLPLERVKSDANPLDSEAAPEPEFPRHASTGRRLTGFRWGRRSLPLPQERVKSGASPGELGVQRCGW